MNKGKLVVLDGLDGSGKSTQLDLITGYFRETGLKVRSVSFPNYNTISGQLVDCYLRGEIPCADRYGAYAASAMYAIDRYVSFVTDWKEYYEAGGIVLAGRYTTSNAIYQLTKLPDDEKEAYLEWLFDFEYGKLGLPQPDAVIFLDMPVEASQKLLDQRYLGDKSKKDIHEKNTIFLQQCRESALFAAERCGWTVLDCARGGLPRPIEDIYTDLCEYLKGVFYNGGT